MEPPRPDSRHVTPDELARFQQGRLKAERLLEVSDHLRSCTFCSVLVPAAPATARAAEAWRRELSVAGDEDHVVPEMLAAYAEGTLGEADREAVVSHLALCPICAEDASDLEEVAQDPSPERARPRPRKAIWASAAGIAAAAVLFLVWRVERQPAVSTASRAVNPALAETPAPAGFADGSRTLRVDADGRAIGAPFAADETTLVAAALRDGRLAIPAGMSGIAAKRSTLLGPQSAAALRVSAPLATAVAATRPTFSWRPLEGARAYAVDVFDEAFAIVAQSPRVTVATWTPDRDLTRGRTYRWQVTAYTAVGVVHAPAPPAPEARFLVLDAEQAAAAADVDRRHAGFPLTLGILYAQLGLLDRAEQHLTKAAAANPQSPVVAALRDAVIRARGEM